MNSTEHLLESISSIASGLFYISETDAAVEAFTAGKFSGDLRGDVLKFSETESGARVQLVEFETFFSKLSAKQEWHTPAQSERAEKFRRLGEFLKSELKDPVVVRIGEIRIGIFVAGIDCNGNVSGVKTFAVET